MERGLLIRRIAQGLFWFGVLSLFAASATMVLGLTVPAAITGALGLAALAANILVAGEIVALAEPRPFSVRGAVVRGKLESHSGLSDLIVGACGTDRVASVVFGPIGKPGFEVIDGSANLRLNQTFAQPNLTRWQANLAPNVLWDIDTSSFVGEHVFDLTSLRIDQMKCHSLMGRIRVQCPSKGHAYIHCRTRFGVLEMLIPQNVGAKMTIERSGLTTMDIRNGRMTKIGENLYATPDYETASAKVEVVLQSTAGEIIITA
jgi:hypothetical protein